MHEEHGWHPVVHEEHGLQLMIDHPKGESTARSAMAFGLEHLDAFLLDVIAKYEQLHPDKGDKEWTELHQESSRPWCGARFLAAIYAR
jgi:hypothetical protein